MDIYYEYQSNTGLVYRIRENVLIVDGSLKHAYGIEIESEDNGMECIEDFTSEHILAEKFLKRLINSNAKPGQLYDYALMALADG
jgi:hypothetical protein